MNKSQTDIYQILCIKTRVCRSFSCMEAKQTEDYQITTKVPMS